MVLIEIAVGLILILFLVQSIIMLKGTFLRGLRKVSSTVMMTVMCLIAVGIIWQLIQGISFSEIYSEYDSKLTWSCMLLAGTAAELLFYRDICRYIRHL